MHGYRAPLLHAPLTIFYVFYNRAIVLEPGNPSMKALAAAEVAPRKNYNKKKEVVPPKKSRVETLQVGGPPKSAYKPGLSSTTPSMSTGKQFSSLSSPPDQTDASSSPLGDVNISKGIGDVGPSQKICKQDTNIGSEKEILTTANNATRNMRENKGKNLVEPIDLQSILISLLMNKPDGMTLKALENAVKGIVSSPKNKIKPIMRNIANYKSPGRYILLPEVGLESSRKPLTESGSSPVDNHPQLSAHEEFHDEAPAPQRNSKENNTHDAPEELQQLKSKVAELTKTFEDFSVQRAAPDMLGEKKRYTLSEGQEGSSSAHGSGSDMEGDSSDNGNGGRSHVRIKSCAAGRGSGSKSDNENDASAKRKECPDEDAEIMTSYDKNCDYKTNASDKSVSSLIPVKSSDGRSLQYQTHDKQDRDEHDAFETEKILSEEQEAEIALTTAAILKDSSRHKHSAQNTYEREEFIKSSTAEYISQAQGSPGTDVQMFEATHTSSPIGFTEGTFKNISKEAVNRADKIGSSNGLQTGYNQTFLGRSATDLTQTGQRLFDLTIFEKSSANSIETSNKQGESSGHIRKHPQKGFRARKGSSRVTDKSHKSSQNKDICVTSKKVSRNAIDNNNGSKQPLSMDSHCVTHGETVGKLSEGRPSTHHDEFFVSSGFSDNLESENKKIADIIFKESTRSHSSTMHSHPQHRKANNVEIGSQSFLAETSGGPISNEFGVTQGIDFEGRSVNNNATGNAFMPDSSEEEAGLASRAGVEFADKNNMDQDLREYFLDENSSYLKYEKAEPQLKGPITSFSQYKEYEQEFHEKYGSYMFLKKACASYSDEFQALCDAAEAAKDDVDKYYSIRGKIMESYRTYGTKHKRMKTIFIILHRELESIKQRITEFVEAQNRVRRPSST
ncbi:putative occludin domain-containing protein [Lupinus albus]|uniref:Putative occludin domain-containing protein n=1 Tax=Lupinus albus TaxID=3870 RepID=A0A6A4PG40_LUPAL|nr:putative occludin domain-containing protein [Lupinus albus]